jgi:hypothetical protein
MFKQLPECSGLYFGLRIFSHQFSPKMTLILAETTRQACTFTMKKSTMPIRQA